MDHSSGDGIRGPHLGIFLSKVRCFYLLIGQSTDKMTRSGIIPETLLPTNWISLTMDMQDGLSCISSMVSSILCGKRPSIGYWELCPIIRVNWHTSQVSVSASYRSCFPFKHVSQQISQFSQPALQVPGVLTPKRHRTPSFFDKIDVAF